MRRGDRVAAELGRGAGLLAQGRLRALGLGVKVGLGVLAVGLLLLVARQAEEEPQNGLQIPIPDLFCRQILYVDSFGCQETEAGINVLNRMLC